MISGNTVYGNLADPIYGQNNLSNISIVNNLIDASSGTSTNTHGIALHTVTAGTSASALTVSGNTITAGNTFCVEIGGFGGNAPSNFNVANNVCTQGAVSGTVYGGYSLANATSGTLTGNTYNANGVTVAGGAGGIELAAGTTKIAATGNVILGTSTLATCIAVNQASDNTVTGNIADSCTKGIHFTTSSAVNLANNVISANHVIVSSTGGYGIYVQCNNASADCSGTTITGNQITGLGTLGTGVQLEQDSGTLSYTVVTGNVFRNLAIGINHVNDSFTLDAGNNFLNTTSVASGTSVSAVSYENSYIQWSNGSYIHSGVGSAFLMNNGFQLGSTSGPTWGVTGTSSTVTSGDVKMPHLRVTLSTPTSSSDTCIAGQVWADASYLYVCTATNTIKQVALATF
jgi:parallel beta-helix repeat protein